MTTKPKRRGPKPSQFTVRVETRLDPATVGAARRLARAQGVSLATFIRFAVKTAVIRDRQIPEVQP